MYNETGFSIQNFILKVILVVLFVFLLIWLFPMPNLKPLYDRIFAENIQTMKEAAKSYYTVERLPKEVNESVKLTLDEMLAMKLVLPIIDSKGKACNGQASYVEVKKTDTEYLIKTLLTCPDQTDYIIEHFGCYDICPDKCVPTETPVTQSAKKTSTTKKATTTNKQVVTKKTETQTTTPVINIINNNNNYNENTNINNGNNEPPTPPTPPTEKSYEYTYRKTITSSKESWSPWTEVVYVDSDNIKFGCTTNKCIEVAPDSPRYEQVGTKTTKTTYYKTDTNGNKVPISRDLYDTIVGTYNIYGCNGYDYVIYENQGTYQYTTGTGWSGPEVVKFKNVSDVPANSATVRYEPAGIVYDNGCEGKCDEIYYAYNKYVRNATKISTSTSSSSINVTCGNPVIKAVNVYGSHYVFEGYKVDYVDVKKTKLYGYVKYYRYKTRTESSSSYVDIQKRDKRDQTLIDNGYELISVVEK